MEKEKQQGITLFDELNKIVEGTMKNTDFTCNGKCSRCGECCGYILPLDQDDLDRVFKYVRENNIHSQKQVLVMKQKLQCPYYTGNKEKGCSIYEARPKVCRLYQCNKKPGLKEAQELKKAIPIDMWSFANDIEMELKK